MFIYIRRRKTDLVEILNNQAALGYKTFCWKETLNKFAISSYLFHETIERDGRNIPQGHQNYEKYIFEQLSTLKIEAEDEKLVPDYI